MITEYESNLTIKDALKICKDHGHELSKLVMSQDHRTKRAECTKSSCQCHLFMDTQTGLIFGGALTSSCGRNSAATATISKNYSSPFKNLYVNRLDKLKDTPWNYDNIPSLVKKKCPKCLEQLYRIARIRDNQRIVGLLCEKCHTVYNVSKTFYNIHRLTPHEKCDKVGKP